MIINKQIITIWSPGAFVIGGVAAIDEPKGNI